MIIIQAVQLLFSAMQMAIFVRIILSWLPIGRDNALISLLYQITEPILGPIRGLIERSPLGRNMMMDFSPIVAFLLLQVVESIVISILQGFII